MRKSEEIERFMLHRFAINWIKDTPENRLVFLKGLRDGLIGDASGFDSSLYLLETKFMISRLQHEINFSK